MRHLGAFADPDRVAADQLHHHQGQAFAHGGAADNMGCALGQFSAGDHFGGDIVGPALGLGEAARQVGDPCHGRHPNAPSHLYLTDL